MGGYLQDYNSAGGSDGVTGYGWVQRECSEVSVRAMCRLDCDDVGPVTTEQATTEQVTTVETTTGAMTAQYLMYTLKGTQTIFSYLFDVDQVPVKNGQFTIPYSTTLPGLSFNHGYFIVCNFGILPIHPFLAILGNNAMNFTTFFYGNINF